MWIILLMSLLVNFYLLLKWLFLKNDLHHITNQLKILNQDLTSQRWIDTTTTKQTIHLINQINIFRAKYIEDKRKFQLKEQAIKQEITHISHDFRTPLTAIKGYVQLLENDENFNETQQKYLNTIHHKVNVLSQQVKTFYELTLIESNDYPVHIQYQPVNAILEHVLLSYYKEMEDQSIALRSYHVSTEKVLLDEAMTQRMLENVLTNVLKYSQSYVSFETTVDEKRLQLAISNDVREGHKLDIDQIFERAYTTSLNRKNGTGIGLYIVRALAKLQGGYVKASQVGSVFTITIDFVRENA